MSTAFRIKTQPEIFAGMVARARILLNNREIDLNKGSVIRTWFETASLSDADQYVQIGKLLDLRSIDDVKGDDLDAFAEAYGANLFPDLKRRTARSSISQIVVGFGASLATGVVAIDVNTGDTTFTLFDGSDFPSSGAVIIDQGTLQQELVIYSRVGDVFTVLYPTTGLQTSHQAGAAVTQQSVRSTLASGIGAGAGSMTLASGTGAAWDASGSVILDRDNLLREILPFTRVGDVLTFTGVTTFAHSAGAIVIQSTSGSDRSIASGSICYVPATDATKKINYRVSTPTASPSSLLDGDLMSDLIAVESEDVGEETRAGARSISKWQTAPFAGATVTNPVSATRGRNRERDDDYRQRIKDFIQSLSRGTPLAIVTGSNGLIDPSTGSTVAFAQIIEPINPGSSILYITDGSETFTLAQSVFIGRDVIISDAESGDKRGHLGQYGPFGYSENAPVTPRLFVSEDSGSATSVGVNYLEDTGKTWTVNEHAGKLLKTDDDQFRIIASNTAIRIVTSDGDQPSLGSYAIFDLSGSPLTPGTDFVFNEATGDLELAVGLSTHDSLIAASDNAPGGVGAYTYSTGLAAYVQRVVNGDPTDFTDFPGIRAAGTKVVVKAPTVVSPTLTFKIIPKRGFSEAQVREEASPAIQISVNALGIGDNIVIAELIRVCMELPSVQDVVPVSPVSNVVITSDQIARITNDNVVIV